MFRIILLYLSGHSVVLAHTATISLYEFDQALDKAVSGENTLPQGIACLLLVELAQFGVF